MNGGGHTGTNFWELGASTGQSDYGGLNLYNTPFGQLFPVLMVELWARGTNGGERLVVEIERAEGALNGGSGERMRELTTSWEKYYIPFGFGRIEPFTRLLIWTLDDAIHVDDIKLYPS